MLAMTPRPRTRLAAGCLGAFVAVVGCSSAAPAAKVVDTSFVVIAPSAQAHDVRPDAVVRVHATKGSLQSVTVIGPDGATLAGRWSPDHTSWASRTPLLTSSSYTVSVAATDAKHHAITVERTFRTLTPKHKLTAAVAPLNGETVGVGQPIAVYFSAPVRNRAAVERHFQVTAEKPGLGAWHWYSDTEMHYRQVSYWPAHERVSLSYDLRGANAGADTWGDQHRTITFDIGASHISKVSATTHSMQVYDDGKLVNTFPVSTGRDKYPTTSGIHVVLNKNPLQLMDSATVGIPRNSPDGYYEQVPWSVRISNSGEFVHDAPWSVHSQGHRNVSHGCINLSPTDSKWFFDFTRRGDIVIVTGTPRQLQQGNGYADWNLSWPDWVATDALL
jgi:lipoprotein-anchoring transpeptidase ErfK/SrfK